MLWLDTDKGILTEDSGVVVCGYSNHLMAKDVQISIDHRRPDLKQARDRNDINLETQVYPKNKSERFLNKLPDDQCEEKLTILKNYKFHWSRAKTTRYPYLPELISSLCSSLFLLLKGVRVQTSFIAMT